MEDQARSGTDVAAISADATEPKYIEVGEGPPGWGPETWPIPVVGGSEDQRVFESMLEAASPSEREILLQAWEDSLADRGTSDQFLEAMREGKKDLLDLARDVDGIAEGCRRWLAEALDSLGDPNKHHRDGTTHWNIGAGRVLEAAWALARPDGAAAYRLVGDERTAAIVKRVVDNGWLDDAIAAYDPTWTDGFPDFTAWECGEISDAIIALREHADIITTFCDGRTPEPVRTCLLALADLDDATLLAPGTGVRIGPANLVHALSRTTRAAWMKALTKLGNDIRRFRARLEEQQRAASDDSVTVKRIGDWKESCARAAAALDAIVQPG